MTSTPKSNTKSASNEPVKQKSSKRIWRCCGIVVFVLIALVIAIGALVISLENYHYMDQQRAQSSQFEQKLGHYQQQLAHIQTKLSQAQVDINKLLSKHLTHQHASQEALQPHPHRHVLSSVNILYVTSANIHVNLALTMLLDRQPVKNIILLLDQAKRDLAPLGQQATTITTLIAQTSQQISLLPTLSPNVIDKSIQQLSSSLSELTLAPIHSSVKHISSQTMPADKDWRAYANQSWHWLKQFLVIRYDKRLSQHLIYQSDRVHFMQLMQVYLQQAVWASWQGHQQQYQQVLAVVAHDISQFTQRDSAQRAWLAQLTVLSKKTVAYGDANQQAALIQISHSLQILAHTLALKESQHA